ncbi:MAG: hypothetical protein M2R45_00364 [Verrucomicrobia subdivision 3 bacterium]|nr:hypothetical protein [Limisphaerales bacterium]MCS1412878.1 hypothetical protein [Limisphaerales bacterium]
MPLYQAAQMKREAKANEIAKLLIEAGADVNYITISGDMLLHQAIANGNKEMVKTLVLAGAQIAVANSQGEMPYRMLFLRNFSRTLLLLGPFHFLRLN